MCVAHAGLIWENRPFQTSTPLSNMRPEICLCKPPEIWHDWAWIKRGWFVCKDPVIIIILIDLHSWPDLMKNAWSHCIHFCYFLKCKPIRPLSVQNLPACENTLQLVRNAQLAAGAGAGGGVWAKPPEKCRCSCCRRSDRRRSAADAGAEQSSTGRVVDTSKHNQNLVQTKFTSSEKCKTYRRRYVQVLQEQMRSSDARDAAPASCNL